MTKKYNTCLTKDYISTWTTIEATRELIQNALDCGSYNIYKNSLDEIVIETTAGEISPQNLLLGVGSKTYDNNTRGGFSEGLLLALLVLARAKTPLQFTNGSKEWTPTFEYNDNYGCETLTIVEEDALTTFENGVKIVVDLGEDVTEEVELNTLQMQDEYDKFVTEKGTILLDDKHKGRIYVGGLFVDSFSSDYGFDFTPESFSLDRDRKTLRPFDIQWEIREMVSLMSRKEVSEEVSDRLVNSMSTQDKAFEYIDENYISTNKNFVNSAEKLYKEEYDGMILTHDIDEADKLKAAGNNNVQYCANKSFVTLIQKSESHQVVFGARKEQEEISSKQLLDNFEDEWQYEMGTELYEAWRELVDELKDRM